MPRALMLVAMRSQTDLKLQTKRASASDVARYLDQRKMPAALVACESQLIRSPQMVAEAPHARVREASCGHCGRLPPIDSITAVSDVRAFLAAGVPEDVTRAALRRASMTDPTIRDFVGLAENQWDFAKPDGVPGFGSLELTAELRRIAANVFGDAPEWALPPPAKAEQDEQATEMSPQPPPAMTTPTLGGSDAEARQPNAPTSVATSAINPKESLPVALRDGKNDAAGQQSAAEGDKA